MQSIRDSMLNLSIVGSMRALMTAGEALKRDNLSSYNCSAIVADRIRALDEMLYILLNGVGVGFSVERQFVQKLPVLAEKYHPTDTTIVVADSKLGWAKAYKELISLLLAGEIPKWDMSKVRPAGSRLKIFGGRSSGSVPLDELFNFTVQTFKEAIGRKLTSFEVHKLFCKIADVVVVGGVRRCMWGDDEVITDKGIKTILDLNVGDSVLTHDKTFKSILAKENSGIRDLWKIKTNIGYLHSTDNHRWAVANSINGSFDWVELKYLKAGDRLIFNSIDASSTYKDFPKDNCFSMPKLDNGLSWFIGYFLGNGSCSIKKRNDRNLIDRKTRVSYPFDFKELEEKLKYNFDRIIGDFGEYKKNTSSEIVSSRKDVTEYFFKYIKQANTSIDIPNFIKQNNKEIICAFLAGLLDSDGSVKNDILNGKGTGIICLVYTKYENFARQVQSLYSLLGIPTKFVHKTRKGKSDEYCVKSINSKFTEIIYNNLKKYSIKLSSDYIMKYSKDTSGLSFSKKLAENGTIKSLFNSNEYLSIYSYEKKTGKNIKFIPITVESIEKFKKDTVYDIQVDKNESFFCNGVLTHNSALISLSNLSDIRMRHAKSGQWWIENPELALANNSVCYTEKPDIGVFMEEWLALYNSKSGERGIFNREACINTVNKINERFGDERRNPNYEFVTNPSLRAGTKVLTTNGIFNIEELEGKKFNVYTGFNNEIGEAICKKTSNSCELHKIILNGMLEIYCSKEHKWPVLLENGYIEKKRTDELEIGDKLLKNELKEKLNFGYIGTYDDGFLVGWNLGDGWITTTSDRKKQQIGFGVYSNEDIESNIHEYIHSSLNKKGIKTNVLMKGKKEINIRSDILINLFKTFGVQHKSLGLPKNTWDKCTDNFRKGLIDGLFSSDGCVSESNISLISINVRLINDVRDLLSFYGIKSRIHKRKDVKDVTIKGKKVKNINSAYHLIVSDSKSKRHFANIFRLSRKDKQSKLKRFNYDYNKDIRQNIMKIISVEKTNLVESVWDLQVNNEYHSFEIAGLITSNCSEIILRDRELCNLSEVVIRSTDTIKELKDKIKKATILGTIQASLTDFKYISSKWKDNCDEERLLGVSMTGIMDNSLTNGSEGKDKLIKTLNELRDYATEVNKEWSKKLGINQAAAITCVKPSGNVSQLVNSSSGIHARYSPYYIRSVRVNKKDPIAKFMIDQGFPHEPDITKPDITTIFKFPIKSPENSITRTDKTAIEQLELWLIYQEHYCDNKPSCTINVKENEWLEVGAWVFKHFDKISGVAFLPSTEHSYKQAPYEECTKEKYEELEKALPKNIDWTGVSKYETTDQTIGSQELSCMSGSCEI